MYNPIPIPIPIPIPTIPTIPTDFLSNLRLTEIQASAGGCLCKCKTYEEHLRKMRYENRH